MRNLFIGFFFFVLLFIFDLYSDQSEPSLQAYHPPAMAKLEAKAWRNYYEHHYFSLAWNMYTIAREQYQFNKIDSFMLAYHAARAAITFQKEYPQSAPLILEHLKRYYTVVQKGLRKPLDINLCAELELVWWSQRRMNDHNPSYYKTMSHLLSEIYGKSSESYDSSTELRAEMMEYRDQRREQGLSESDWSFIESGLEKSYTLLKSRF